MLLFAEFYFIFHQLKSYHLFKIFIYSCVSFLLKYSLELKGDVWISYSSSMLILVWLLKILFERSSTVSYSAESYRNLFTFL